MDEGTRNRIEAAPVQEALKAICVNTPVYSAVDAGLFRTMKTGRDATTLCYGVGDFMSISSKSDNKGTPGRTRT
jgi:hypothetical protein